MVAAAFGTLIACDARSGPAGPSNVDVVELLAPRLALGSQRPEDGKRIGSSILQAPGSTLTFRLAIPSEARLRGRLASERDPVEGGAVVRVLAREGELRRSTLAGPVPQSFDLEIPGDAGRLVAVELVASSELASPLLWQDLRIEGRRPVRPRPALGPRARYNVIVLVFDSLRADHLAPWDPGASTPHVRALAEQGVTFLEARSAASWTRPSIASLLTSTSPMTHGVNRIGEGLPSWLPYLPEHLSQHGYTTIGVTHSAQISPEAGFARGFGSLEILYERDLRTAYAREPSAEGRARLVFEKHVAPELDRLGDRPFFLYVHEMDPHYPYDPPAPWGEQALRDYAGPLPRGADVPRLVVEQPEWLDAADVAHLNALYRAEIAFMPRDRASSDSASTMR